MTRSANRYHALTIGAHWLTLLLLIGVYALIELRGVLSKGSALRDDMKTWHFMLGLTVFGLVFVRLALRRAFCAPAIMPRLPRWQELLAHAMHIALYAFLIVMPLLGWLTLSAKGRMIPWFGLELPPLVGPNEALGRSAQRLHETIGTIGYYLIGLHASVGLLHHYCMRDDTLMRMLPWQPHGRTTHGAATFTSPRSES